MLLLTLIRQRPSGHIPVFRAPTAFQADDEGSIPFTRSIRLRQGFGVTGLRDGRSNFSAGGGCPAALVNKADWPVSSQPGAGA